MRSFDFSLGVFTSHWGKFALPCVVIGLDVRCCGVPPLKALVLGIHFLENVDLVCDMAKERVVALSSRMDE